MSPLWLWSVHCSYFRLSKKRKKEKVTEKASRWWFQIVQSEIRQWLLKDGNYSNGSSELQTHNILHNKNINNLQHSRTSDTRRDFLFSFRIEEQFVYVTLGKALQIALYNLAISLFLYIYCIHVYIICIYTHFVSLTAHYKLLHSHSCRERNLRSEATSDKTLHVVCAP